MNSDDTQDLGQRARNRRVQLQEGSPGLQTLSGVKQSPQGPVGPGLGTELVVRCLSAVQ